MEIGGVRPSDDWKTVLGDSAHLFLKSAKSNIVSSLSGRINYLKFESRTEGSFLKRILLNGFNDGHTELSVEFEESKQASARKYFGDHGLFQYEFSSCHATGDQMKVLFGLIERNNTFDPGCLEMIRPRVETGRWEQPVDPNKIHDLVDVRTFC